MSDSENDRNFIGYSLPQNRGLGLGHHLSPPHRDLGPGLRSRSWFVSYRWLQRKNKFAIIRATMGRGGGEVVIEQLTRQSGCRSYGRLVYFDTNVFDPKHGLLESQENLLHNAFAAGVFRAVCSIDCFVEPLLVFESGSDEDRKKTAIQIQRILRWCDLRRIVKPADRLLTDDIVSYADTGHPAGAFLEDVELRAIISAFRQWNPAKSPGKRDWQSIIRDAGNERDQFQSQMAEMLEELRRRIATGHDTISETFDKHWTKERMLVAETFVNLAASYAGQADVLESCKKYGVDGLLDIRSVHLAVLATLSLMYSQLSNDGHQTRDSRPSDAADIRHAISASAADVFVTNDHRLQKQLSGVPVKDFQVLHLSSFLESL